MEQEKWTSAIDIYCERLDASFWAEPVNALTNIFFLMAAYLLYRDYRALREKQPEQKHPWILFSIAVVALIGVGSFLFHTFATRWALMADVWPINLFMVMAVALYFRQVLELSKLNTLLGTLGFIAANAVAGALLPADFLNGSGGYLPSLLMLVIFIIGCQKLKKKRVQASIAAALVVFIVSLFMRSIDMQICAEMRTGTHFMWHILNSLVLYHVVQGLMRNKGFRPIPEKDTPH